MRTPPKFSSTPPEKFEIGVHIVSYYYYRLYLKKLIHLAVRVQLTDNLNKCNYYIYIYVILSIYKTKYTTEKRLKIKYPNAYSILVKRPDKK